jgi:hypothetical protein
VDDKLGITFDLTYMSKLQDKSGSYYGSKSALLQTVDFDL